MAGGDEASGAAEGGRLAENERVACEATQAAYDGLEAAIGRGVSLDMLNPLAEALQTRAAAMMEAGARIKELAERRGDP